MKLNRIASLLTLVALSGMALADQSAAGNWKGRIVFDSTKSTIKDPATQKLAQQQMDSAKKIAITLNLKGDKTFAGGPPPSTGKWSQTGNKVSLTPTGQTKVKQVFTLSKDGKTMTYELPTNQGIKAKIVLTR